MYSTDSRDDLIGWINPNRVFGEVHLIEKERSFVKRMMQWSKRKS